MTSKITPLTKEEAIKLVTNEWSQNPLDYEGYIDSLVKGDICDSTPLKSIKNTKGE